MLSIGLVDYIVGCSESQRGAFKGIFFTICLFNQMSKTEVIEIGVTNW